MLADLQPPLRQICCSVLAIVIRGANKEHTLPLMKLKQSCCPLASIASHWPPVSSTGGSSDGGGGVRFFSYCLHRQGTKSGTGAAGAGGKSANDWPRFSPDLARINTVARVCPSWPFTKMQGMSRERGGHRGGYMRSYARPAGADAILQEGINGGTMWDLGSREQKENTLTDFRSSWLAENTWCILQ